MIPHAVHAEGRTHEVRVPTRRAASSCVRRSRGSDVTVGLHLPSDSHARALLRRNVYTAAREVLGVGGRINADACMQRWNESKRHDGRAGSAFSRSTRTALSVRARQGERLRNNTRNSSGQLCSHSTENNKTQTVGVRRHAPRLVATSSIDHSCCGAAQIIRARDTRCCLRHEPWRVFAAKDKRSESEVKAQ